MELITPKTMPGAMELLPRDQIAFQRMLDTIRRSYERFGFLPVETPVMEYKRILLTKSGGETERQVYYAQSKGAHDLERDIEFCLRFDLTVPLARYVAEHEKKLIFPFRRYQMQRVYRGESAQRGRYREFYQCDIDVIGKDNLPLEYDAEIPVVIYHLFKELDFGKFTIHINNRKLLSGFFASLGIEPEAAAGVMREIDKLDKRGMDYVVETLTGETFGLSAEIVDKILGLIQLEGSNSEKLNALTAMNIDDETFQTGLDELKRLVDGISHSGVPEAFCAVNLSIARGLDYYTGTVYETLLDDYPKVGSVCSGGRYENLAGFYSKSKLPGVGISIGATRLFYQLQQASLIKQETSTTRVLVTRMDLKLSAEYLALASELRETGLNTEVYYGGGKFAKQMRYADRSGIRFAVIMGETEAAKGTVTLKDLHTGDQVEVNRADLAAVIEERLA
ncbi:MAG: histidine--tRNA ligase [Acidobacteriota bacterium]|nr:histidine--tRNA ligase [Acidobacteriota bacterium]